MEQLKASKIKLKMSTKDVQEKMEQVRFQTILVKGDLKRNEYPWKVT
jgi:hypothetical protein